MRMHCRLIPKNEAMESSIVHRLRALGHSPTIDADGSVVVNYDGVFDQHAMAIVSVFDSFGCDRAIIFKDWGVSNGKGQEASSSQSCKIMLV